MARPHVVRNRINQTTPTLRKAMYTRTVWRKTFGPIDGIRENPGIEMAAGNFNWTAEREEKTSR